MSSMLATEWRKLPITLTELCLATTLRCGQSFRWRKTDNETWACSLRGRILQLAQDSTHLRYRALYPAAFEAPATPPSSMAAREDEDDDTEELIQHYLNLEPNLDQLYQQWSGADKNFSKKAPKFTGVRILRQDAWEALVGFICSSNNNIIRISQMVDKLCLHYGRHLGSLDGHVYHDFPSPAALTGQNVESHLRSLGFGYRAKYIARTANMIAHEREDGWLDSIRNPESPVFGMKSSPAGQMRPEGRDGYIKAHGKLLDLQGVGPKVADCVCLMGLGWGEAVPVDTHVWQIAQRDYKFGKGKHSSLTTATYGAVANHFRKLWGKEAGWAHSVLFTADLRAFSQQLAAKVEIKTEIGAEPCTPESTPMKKESVKIVRIKREFDDDEDERKVLKIEETSTITAMDAVVIESAEKQRGKLRQFHLQPRHELATIDRLAVGVEATSVTHDLLHRMPKMPFARRLLGAGLHMQTAGGRAHAASGEQSRVAIPVCWEGSLHSDENRRLPVVMGKDALVLMRMLMRMLTLLLCSREAFRGPSPGIVDARGRVWRRSLIVSPLLITRRPKSKSAYGLPEHRQHSAGFIHSRSEFANLISSITVTVTVTVAVTIAILVVARSYHSFRTDPALATSLLPICASPQPCQSVTANAHTSNHLWVIDFDRLQSSHHHPHILELLKASQIWIPHNRDCAVNSAAGTMRLSKLEAAVAASMTILLPSAQAATAVPKTNLDFSQLGQVALAGDFDSISVYEYEGQKEGFSNNGSTSILSSLPNGAYQVLASTDASINAMVNFVLSDGTLAGIVVGGNFTSIGGVDAASVALFNPTTNQITPLPGIHGAVTSLFNVPETDTIYVGGSFEAANSTNAIAWIGTTGWANLPFAGFNAPVTSITQAPNGHIVFGGSFSGLGNMTTPTGSKANAQVINLSSANITTLESTGAAGFKNAKNIVCPSSGTDGTSSTWLLADQVAGWWRADMGFGYQPTKLRLWNTNQDGRGTKTFRFVAHPINGIMNFTYLDPTTGKIQSCDAECTLAHNASNPYQDFTFVNVIGMNSFTIEILDWYGAGAGLDGIELFQDDIFVYADNDFNEPSCSGAEFPSTATKTGPWSTVPSGNSTNRYLGATVQGSTLDQTAVTFQPDMKTKGNYSVIIYTPGCLQDSSCATRGIVNVSGTLTAGGGTAFSTQIFQTNQYEKYDQIFLGEVDAASASFRPSVTLTPAAGQGDMHVVASRVKFGQLSLTGGLNGLFEYDPNMATVNTDFSESAINNAGTSLKPSARITALVTKDQTIYAAGSFSDDTFDNIMAFKNNNATSLDGGGLNDAVSTMYTMDDFLYVGGNFSKTQSGSVQGLNNIGAYSFSKNSWTALGAGLDGPVYSIVPLQLNITADTPETTIAMSGDFSNIKAFGSSSSKSANGLAVWVPSHSDWLQNLNVTQLALAGKLCSYVDVLKGPHLVAGDLASAGWGISGVAGLSQSGSDILLEQLPLKIASSNSQSSLSKRALSGSENVTGVVTGTYYENGSRNVTVFGGHFTGTATNGSTIQNLLFLNASDNNQVTGMKFGIDSNSTFLALATQSDLLFAGGAVTGQVGDASINGLVVYDMLTAAYRTPQPAALVGPNVVVNAITVQQGTTQLYVGGSFQETAQQLSCASVCMYDTSTNQWNSVGSNLDGTVTALFWASNTVLMAAGNLTLNANGSSAGTPTYVATYNTKQQTWTAIQSNAIPGAVTAFASAMQDGSQYWVSGVAKNGSIFLINMDNDNDKPVWHAFDAGTNIRGISVQQLTSSHGSSQYLDKDQSLLLTGMINLPNYGNVSAALFNGTAFEPFILSSTNSGGPGSISQVFTSKTNPLKSNNAHHSRGITVLVALCAALGSIFLIILLGLILNRVQRHRAGYNPVPQVPYQDKHSNINRVPPERLFGSLGNKSPPQV